MASQDQNLNSSTKAEEIPERLDEQHIFTTETLGFLVHPHIPLKSASLKIADAGTGTGIWLLDVAKSLPPTCSLTGFDVTLETLPPRETWPANVSFRKQDMTAPFAESELGSYDVVAARFISSATTRAEWERTIRNLMTLLKPGGWLQWIDSCNFALYSSAAGCSRAACQEIYDGLEPMRTGKADRKGDEGGDDLVIGMMMRESQNVRRQDTFRSLGLVDVHEDVFSTDRLQDPALQLRKKGTRNAITLFAQCLENLVGPEKGWHKERVDKVRAEAMKEIDAGAYHTLDHVCIIGKKP